MGIVSSISSIIGSNEEMQQARAYLVELDDSGSMVEYRAFQYFPQTIDDSKSGDYVEKTVIGSSHPIYQWLHGGKRSISFDAVLTSDFTKGTGQNPLGAFGAVAETVTSFIKSPAATAISTLSSGGQDPYDPDGSTGKNVNIAAGISWFRSKLYPTYKGNEPVKPPPKLLLVVEGTEMSSYVGSYKTGVIPCIMSRCDVSYESFFRDGSPRVATLSLEFWETVQIGKSWSWVSRDSFKGGSGKYKYGADRTPKGV